MKPLIFFFIFGLSAYTCYTQDTLVDSKGLIFPARITAVDSNFITYASPDTLLKEQIIIPRSTIIFIKYENGKTEQLFANDTLITKDGIFLFGKVIEIDPTSVIYFSYNGRLNPPTVMMKSDFLLIKLHDGTKELLDPSSDNSGVDYFGLGKVDAKNYYKPAPGLLVWEVICGLTTIFIFPIAPATICAYVPPIQLNNSANPNDALLDSNTTYKAGFMSEAKKKKRRAATTAYFSGLGALIAGGFLYLTYFF
jgi:hypothetical protein